MVKPVLQIGQNCFGACVAMLTGIKQTDLPVEGDMQPSGVSFHFKGSDGQVYSDWGHIEQDEKWRYWRSLILSHGWETVLHEKPPIGVPYMLPYLFLDDEVRGHVVVVDNDRIIDPAGWTTGMQATTLRDDFCNVLHGEYITFERATVRRRVWGWLRLLLP